ncbi:hypothetical protein PoB_003504700 [Plakobranchus ocellatus]|uniref:Uncharacterized protein n=1 Tax=Plakobranchus ocellatus TaxID=259542 RepID=A0AAV4AMQ8_9GAST|nr:hypothetical protein PoB_003504700 [Plakobranchus ocellatus]
MNQDTPRPNRAGAREDRRSFFSSTTTIRPDLVSVEPNRHGHQPGVKSIRCQTCSELQVAVAPSSLEAISTSSAAVKNHRALRYCFHSRSGPDGLVSLVGVRN